MGVTEIRLNGIRCMNVFCMSRRDEVITNKIFKSLGYLYDSI